MLVRSRFKFTNCRTSINVSFGFIIDDLNKIDSRPSLYFTQEEADAAKYVTGKEKYGCSSNIHVYDTTPDDINLLKINIFKIPVITIVILI